MGAKKDSLALCQGGMGERIQKVRKLVGWDKGGLRGEAKAVHVSKEKQGLCTIREYLELESTCEDYLTQLLTARRAT